MRLFLDIDTREFLQSPSFPRALTTLALKRRDTDLIELQFLRDRVVQELPTGTTIRLGLKPDAAYTAEFLASGTFTKSGTGTATKYLLDLNLNTVTLNTAFAAATPEPVTLAAMLEVEWASGTTISSSLTLPVTIANDVIRGNEGTPATLPLFYTASTSDFKATQAQAEAGTSNETWMTPLRVKELLEGAQIPSIQVGGDETAGFTINFTGQDPTKLSWYNLAHPNFELNFEEGAMRDSGGDVMFWGPGYVGFNERTLQGLGAPVNPPDAVRLADLASGAAVGFTTANQSTPYSAPGNNHFNLRITVNSSVLTADPIIILPNENDGAKYGATYRLVYNRTGHTRSLIVRHYVSGTNLTTLSTLTNTGVFGFCFNGTDWQTESSWTGLQPVA
jgi:hypothetical protein